MWSKEIFWSKKFLGKKYFWAENIFGSKKTRTHNVIIRNNIEKRIDIVIVPKTRLPSRSDAIACTIYKTWQNLACLVKT